MESQRKSKALDHFTNTSSNNSSTIDDLIEALSSPRVSDAIFKCIKPSLSLAIDEAINKFIAPLQKTIETLKKDAVKTATETLALTETVARVEQENVCLRQLVDAQGVRVEEMERYSRRDNLIISGLPEGSYAEAATNANDDTPEPNTESSLATEKSVLKLFRETMGLQLTADDITVAHRLKKGKKDTHRPIIVRLVNKRTRDTILKAKKSLRNSAARGEYI